LVVNFKRDLKVFSHKSKEFVLSNEEIEKMIAACKNEKEKMIILTLIFTGLRVGEFVHLRTSWINWQKKVPLIIIPIHQDCDCKECKREGRGTVWSAKTKAGVREIPIMEIRTREALKRYYTFENSVNMTKVGVWKVVKRVAVRAGLTKRVFPHALRATTATIFGHKASAPSVAYIMGWSKIGTAEQYVQSAKRRALEELEDVEL